MYIYLEPFGAPDHLIDLYLPLHLNYRCYAVKHLPKTSQHSTPIVILHHETKIVKTYVIGWLTLYVSLCHNTVGRVDVYMCKRKRRSTLVSPTRQLNDQSNSV
jgi:hypothetical protein